ncbi:hypothetical protein AB0D27_17800 [Streptomyces sp. NPDC048415]|jgi:hypothetical protein|uniref:hypothetical protein n=1 Tax=Streptomyces sp. NPDC048415 TaxID=3154822 RepID=UPI00344A12F6
MAITLGAAASLAGLMATASAAPPAAQAVKQQAARPVIVDCFWHSEVRPGDFILACGDGNSRLVSLHWSQWLSNSAVATGFNVVNDCKPYCAAGKFHSYAVVVRLDQPQPWKKRPHLQHYTRMSLVYTNGRPEGFERTVSYPLWD